MGEGELASWREKKRQKWAEHIKDCNGSGKSQAQYCRDNGLNPSLFYYWKRRFKVKTAIGLTLVPVGMHPIQVHHPGSIATPLVLIMGQYKVEIGPGFDQATLGRVVQVLDRI